MEGWVVDVTAVASNGDLTQIYPTWCSAGTAPGSAVNADQIREPTPARMSSFQVKTNSIDGGIIELWDINGLDGGADVSSLAAITNTQATALQTAGKAKLVYQQNFTADPDTPLVNKGPIFFAHGIAARFVGSTGTATLNFSIESGGYRKTTKVG